MTIKNMFVRGGLAALMTVGTGMLTHAQSRQSDRSNQSQSKQSRQSDDRGDRQQEQQQHHDQSQHDEYQSDSQRQSDSRKQRSMRDRSQDQWSNQKSNQKRDQQSRSSDSAQYQLEPQGWLTVAVDYDRDGRYDALETIYVYDFEKAKQESENRKRAGMDQARRSGNMQRDGQREADRQQSQSRNRLASMRRSRDGMQQRNSGKRLPRLVSCQGTIESMRKETMAGGDTQWVLARVEGDNGKTDVVCLGSAQKLNQLDLGQGDQIQIKGVKARMNDRPIVMATQIRHNGKQLDTRLPGKVSLKRVKAELKSMRTVKFRGLDQPHIVAQVKTRSGKNELVNMGPKSQYDQVDLSEGDSLKLLVRPGTIGGEDALIVQEANIDGKRIHLPRPEDQKKFQKRRKSAQL